MTSIFSARPEHHRRFALFVGVDHFFLLDHCALIVIEVKYFTVAL